MKDMKMSVLNICKMAYPIWPLLRTILFLPNHSKRVIDSYVLESHIMTLYYQSHIIDYPLRYLFHLPAKISGYALRCEASWIDMALDHGFGDGQMGSYGEFDILITFDTNLRISRFWAKIDRNFPKNLSY